MANRVAMHAEIERWPFSEPFKITGFTFEEFQCVKVVIKDGEIEGRGEAAGVYYLNDTPEAILAQLEKVRSEIEAGASREALQQLLPAGGARNALDCALWDLAAKRAKTPVWRLAALPRPTRLVTTFTISAASPQIVAKRAKSFRAARALKLKLAGEDDAACLSAVRAARPDVWLGIDANQGLTPQSFNDLLPTLKSARVALIEQPFPIGCDDWLDGLECPIPIAADESVQTAKDVERLVGRVQLINVKLDKAGGLTEALEVAAEARRCGLKIMVGNMFGTSLGMAPAFLLGQLCNVVDLDGPVSLRTERSPPMDYAGGLAWCPKEVWGYP